MVGTWEEKKGKDDINTIYIYKKLKEIKKMKNNIF